MAKRRVRKRKAREARESPQDGAQDEYAGIPVQTDASMPVEVVRIVGPQVYDPRAAMRKAAEERPNPYVWRRYWNPFDGFSTDAGLHPLDELINAVHGHRVCFLIDLMPERWPRLVKAIGQTNLTPAEAIAAAKAGSLRVVNTED